MSAKRKFLDGDSRTSFLEFIEELSVEVTIIDMPAHQGLNEMSEQEIGMQGLEQ